MAATINADDGVVSGSAGLKYSADSSGVLALQTNGTTAVTVDASQNTTLAGTLTTSSRGIAKASLPTGSVLQVINATTSTPVTNNTSTVVTTGLTASITPLFSTSKILVIASVAGISKFTNNTGALLQLFRDAVNICGFGFTAGANDSANTSTFAQTTNFLDSPATTSSTTYAVYFGSQQNNAGILVQQNGDASTITLMEIAA
jgi:hypothetical protein